MRLLSKWRLLLRCSAVGMVRYTKKARRAVFCASEEAMLAMSSEVTPQNLLVGLLRADESLAAGLGLPRIDWVRDELTETPQECRRATGSTLSEGARQVILRAAEERERLRHKHTGTEHLLLGIIRSDSEAARLLERQGWTGDRVRQLVSQHSLTWGRKRLTRVRTALPAP